MEKKVRVIRTRKIIEKTRQALEFLEEVDKSEPGLEEVREAYHRLKDAGLSGTQEFNAAASAMYKAMRSLPIVTAASDCNEELKLHGVEIRRPDSITITNIVDAEAMADAMVGNEAYAELAEDAARMGPGQVLQLEGDDWVYTSQTEGSILDAVEEIQVHDSADPEYIEHWTSRDGVRTMDRRVYVGPERRRELERLGEEGPCTEHAMACYCWKCSIKRWWEGTARTMKRGIDWVRMRTQHMDIDLAVSAFLALIAMGVAIGSILGWW